VQRTLTQIQKVFTAVLRGVSDANISFQDLVSLLHYLGFEERIRGSHHIFTKFNVDEIINIQPKGNKAKPYQVKQIRNLVLKYKMGNE
jgi:hypothetical protein